MRNIKSQFKGNVGLFLVCVEISKRNLIALPTSRNTKGYDLIVLNHETNKSVALQIKCSDKREFPILSSNWGNYDEAIDMKILSDYIFVDISNIDKPRYFILSKNERKNIVKILIKGYLKSYQQRHNLTLEEMIRKEEYEKRKPDLWSIRLDNISQYEDKWESITSQLQ